MSSPTDSLAAAVSAAPRGEASGWRGRRGASPVSRSSVLFRGSDLLLTRWVITGAQTLAVIIFGDVLRLPVPFEALSVVILASVLVNLAATVSHRSRAEPGAGENAAYLAFDILQMAAILWLAGGSPNPFCLAMVLPVRMAGVMLPIRLAAILTVMAIGLIGAMVVWATPMPWTVGAVVTLPLSYRITCGLAETVGVFAGLGFGHWTARQASRMELALGITETVLAREQRLSALGALAAATAHELGSPLATIAVIARELSRDAPEGPLRDDALLVVNQVSRCRDILQRLAHGPEAADAISHEVALSELLRQAAAALAGSRSVTIETRTSGPTRMVEPSLRRRPELLHALNCLVENAVDFAQAKVELCAAFDEDWVVINVCDDGPGFSSDILPRLGEPYVTSRAGADPSGVDHVGLGLGVFIAKTFLERTGANVSFGNADSGGAHVAARWARAEIEAT